MTREGLFAVLGSLYYAEALLEARFDDETKTPAGVQEALSELEDAKEPLILLLLGPPDLRTAFVEYLEKTHGIKHQFLVDAQFAVKSEFVTAGPRISMVKNEN